MGVDEEQNNATLDFLTVLELHFLTVLEILVIQAYAKILVTVSVSERQTAFVVVVVFWFVHSVRPIGITMLYHSATNEDPSLRRE